MTFAQSLTQASSPETSAHVTDELQTLQPACVAEKYEFLQKLGKGSQGNVWQAKSRSHGELVAIKQLHVHSVTTWKQYELFKREAETLASLEIDGVVPFREYIEDLEANPPYVCIVQKFVEGQTLAEMLKKKHRFETETIYDIITQVLKILQNLHEHRPAVIHRDIKPSNLMLTLREDGKYRVTLLDFGAVANPQVQNGGSTVAGTFGYMPPEQLMGQAGPASDIYALAAVAVELLSGTSPADIEVCDFKLVIEPYLTHVDQAVVQTLCLMLEPSLQNRLCDYNALIAQFSNLAHKEEISFLNFFKNDKIPKLEDVQSICQPGNYELWQNFDSKVFALYIRKLIKTKKQNYGSQEFEGSSLPSVPGFLSGEMLIFLILAMFAGIAHISGILKFFLEDSISEVLMLVLVIVSIITIIILLNLRGRRMIRIANYREFEMLKLDDDLFNKLDGFRRYESSLSKELLKLPFSQKVMGKIVSIEYVPVLRCELIKPGLNPAEEEHKRLYEGVRYNPNANKEIFVKQTPSFKITYRYRLPKDFLYHIVSEEGKSVAPKISESIFSEIDLYAETIIHHAIEDHCKVGDLLPLLCCIQQNDSQMLTIHSMPYPFPFESFEYHHEVCDALKVNWAILASQNEEQLLARFEQFILEKDRLRNDEQLKLSTMLCRWGYLKICHSMAKQYSANGDIAKAIEIYQYAVNGNDVSAMINLGNLEYKRKNLKIALDWFMKAFELGNLDGCYKIAQILKQMGRDKSLAKWKDTFLSVVHPLAEQGELDACREMANYYFQAKEEETAFSWIAKIYQYQEHSGEFIEQTANMYKENANDMQLESECQLAIYWLTAMLKQKPNDIDLMLDIAQICFEYVKDYKQAKYWFVLIEKRLSKEDPVYQSIKDYIQLSELLARYHGQAYVSYDELPEIVNEIARFYSSRNEYEQSVHWYEKNISTYDEHMQALFDSRDKCKMKRDHERIALEEAAQIYEYKLHKIVDAIKCYEILALFYEQKEIHDKLAVLYESIGNRIKASYHRHCL